MDSAYSPFTGRTTYKVQCTQCEYKDWPAWVVQHMASEHPEVHEGHCTDCGGHSKTLVMTPDGLQHRTGSMCDRERESQWEDYMHSKHPDL